MSGKDGERTLEFSGPVVSAHGSPVSNLLDGR